MNKNLTQNTIVYLALSALISCQPHISAPSAPVLPHYLQEPDVAMLSNDDLFARMRWEQTECVREADKLGKAKDYAGGLEILKDCKARALSNDWKVVGTEIAKRNLAWPETLKHSLKLGIPLAIGMTSKQALLLLGQPTDRKVTLFKNRAHEQWVYRINNTTRYVYFENGVATSVQF